MTFKKYFNQNHQIYHGDILECFKDIESNSVDLVFADPPYNIGKDFDGIPDKYIVSEYLIWMKTWISEIHRVLKDSGSAYLMNSTQNLSHMDMISQEFFHVMSRIAWVYDSSGVQAKKFFGSSWEPILYLVKDKENYKFNAKDILIEAKTGAKRGLIDYRKTPPQPYNTTKVPSNVWDFNRVRFRMEEYENHPSQKPLGLLERVILASSNKGDVVLDPFSGTFTTSAAAAKLGRKSIGFDLNIEYVKIGLRRLNIESEFSLEDLMKVKQRKTTNKSKKDHSQNINLDF